MPWEGRSGNYPKTVRGGSRGLQRTIGLGRLNSSAKRGERLLRPNRDRIIHPKRTGVPGAGSFQTREKGPAKTWEKVPKGGHPSGDMEDFPKTPPQTGKNDGGFEKPSRPGELIGKKTMNPAQRKG